MIEVGQPIPEDLRQILKDVTGLSDWAIVAANENKTSASTLRNVLNGMLVTEQSCSTVIRLVEFASKKVDDQQAKASRQKKVLKSFLQPA